MSTPSVISKTFTNQASHPSNLTLFITADLAGWTSSKVAFVKKRTIMSSQAPTYTSRPPVWLALPGVPNVTSTSYSLCTDDKATFAANPTLPT